MKQWFRSGTPWIWLTGGAVTISIVMVVGLLSLIAVRGLSHFWPGDVAQVEITNFRTGEVSSVMGEIVRSETITASMAREGGNPVAEDQDLVTRYLFKQGNRDQFGTDFVWHFGNTMGEVTYPKGVFVIERREWGNFYGFPVALLTDGLVTVTADHESFPTQLAVAVERAVTRANEQRQIERREVGRINTAIERIRLELRSMELQGLDESELATRRAELERQREALDAEYDVLRQQMDELQRERRRDALVMRMTDGREVTLNLSTIIAITQPNDMSLTAKFIQYFAKIGEFLSTEPREANTEGGIFPAIFGTITMVFIMSIMVTPFGILAAIYLREYAKQGPITRMIRISVYNLAGVPSIVFGVFGLGFFVYFLGGNIDRIFYEAALPSPTYGTPGLFWASLTLALLTLPVVIVSTEEGLARIPSTVRQGSLALGATKSETLWRVVVPLATPGMMTGLILAIARAAGEVAPLMLVGVVKLAPNLPIDGEFPFIHLERKIMHLGFHIFDVGFQSPNVEASRPLVYATALVLVVLIVMLNLTAISIRNRLREKYRSDSD
ncbi:phosphate ABC transporter permease PstA [Aliidiomarina halalkaliphila]|uniref:Phosphate transport system permease protein PstA n=1 Tax=Aliidiomarina halalkaliphila TaxID=2593535 RepID=A0A552WZS5_9GAMM|nr:phosphate ABC transporter permease PstA [Aliidiomarina halalkaliphila]TRW48089.1 phosphate ABC transporter permease PstA [Aliidiomarina halalkaliphila]